MSDELEQRVVSAVAALQAERGEAAPESDVVLRLVPRTASPATRREFAEAVSLLTPRFLVRVGPPTATTLQLTAIGWLSSDRREDVSRLAKIFLEAYRSIADEGALHAKRISWRILESHGMHQQLRGLLCTAGSELHLYAEGFCAGVSGPTHAINLALPWDIEELLHIPSGEEFLDYRAHNPPRRVLFLKRLRNEGTGEMRRAVDAILKEARDNQWPLYNRVEVILRRRGDRLDAAVNGGFAVRIDGDSQARVGLTYKGLWLATQADEERRVVLHVLRQLSKAYSASPGRTALPAEAVFADAFDDDDLENALFLLRNQFPKLVSTSNPSTFQLSDWLLDINTAATFDDLLYSMATRNEDKQVAALEGFSENNNLFDHRVAPAIVGVPSNDFVIAESLGSGEHGDVYSAMDRQLDRMVAVKFVRDSDFAHDAVLHHARALSRGNHPAIVRVYTVTHLPHPENGAETPAIVMEYIGGDDLPAYLQGKSYPFSTAAVLAGTLIDAMDALHKANACHGDLHPNQIRVWEGTLRILDLYHRPSVMYASTRTLEQSQADDRRQTRRIVSSIIGNADNGRILSDQFEKATNEDFAPTFSELRAALQQLAASTTHLSNSNWMPGSSKRATLRRLLDGHAVDRTSPLQQHDSELASDIVENVAEAGLAIMAALERVREPAAVWSLPSPRVLVPSTAVISPEDETVCIQLPYSWLVIEEWVRRLRERRVLTTGSAHGDKGFQEVALTPLGVLVVHWGAGAEAE